MSSEDTGIGTGISNQSSSSPGGAVTRPHQEKAVDTVGDTRAAERSRLDYPQLRYSLTRKAPLTYNEAVENIRIMFVQQAELWKKQALELERVFPGHVSDENGASLAALSQRNKEGETLLASPNNDRKRSAVCVDEANDEDEMGQETIKILKKRLKGVRQYKFERSEGSAAPSDDDSVQHSKTGTADEFR